MGSPDSLLKGVTWGTRESLLAGAGPGTSDILLDPGGTRLTLLACTAGLADTWTVELQTKVPTRARLKAATTAFTFETLLRHYDVDVNIERPL